MTCGYYDGHFPHCIKLQTGLLWSRGPKMVVIKAMAPHSSTLAWKIPWMEEPGGLQSTESLRVDWANSLSLFTFHFHALEKEMATHSSVLAWRIPGMGEPHGLPSMGSHRVEHDWSNLAAAATCSLEYRPPGFKTLQSVCTLNLTAEAKVVDINRLTRRLRT